MSSCSLQSTDLIFFLSNRNYSSLTGFLCFQLSGKGFCHLDNMFWGCPCIFRLRLHPYPNTKDFTFIIVTQAQKIPKAPPISSQWWTTLGKTVFLRHCHLVQKEDYWWKRSSFLLDSFSSFKGVWLKAKTIIPDLSHTKMMLYGSLWMRSCSRKCLIRWVTSCVNCNVTFLHICCCLYSG